MNALCGIIRLDGQPVDKPLLKQVSFTSPKWKPDHHTILVKENIGLTCTQRFITPECSQSCMPYEHPEIPCLIGASVYCSNREELIQALGIHAHQALMMADCALALEAYLKWGKDCARFFHGKYFIAIWDKRDHIWFFAVDRGASVPCFFAYKEGRYFIFANYFSPFRILCDSISLNQNLFACFALDTFSETETCYHEVKKLPTAGYAQLKNGMLSSGKYWSIKDDREPVRHVKREDYYAHFREIFEHAVKNCLRSNYPIHSHISGGLDSTSVACMAAKLLANQQRALHGFTAISRNLDGPSYRSGWHYHELPLVQEVLRHYPNIQHTVYQTSPETDLFEILKTFYPQIDQPIRNMPNFDWIIASYDQTLGNQGRTLLSGQCGNGSISWTGDVGFVQKSRQLCAMYKIWLKPHTIYNDYYHQHRHDFMTSTFAQSHLRRKILATFHSQDFMLSGQQLAPLQSSVAPIGLWHGVIPLDPTRDENLIKFCRNIPQWVYRKGSDILQRRLLVREGLAGCVPEAVRHNTYRGEQAADWYLQYNTHHSKWLHQLKEWKDLPMVWDIYEYDQIMAKWEILPHIEQVTSSIVLHYGCNYLRCFGLCNFLSYLEKTLETMPKKPSCLQAHSRQLRHP